MNNHQRLMTILWGETAMYIILVVLMFCTSGCGFYHVAMEDAKLGLESRADTVAYRKATLNQQVAFSEAAASENVQNYPALVHVTTTGVTLYKTLVINDNEWLSYRFTIRNIGGKIVYDSILSPKQIENDLFLPIGEYSGTITENGHVTGMGGGVIDPTLIKRVKGLECYSFFVADLNSR